MTKKTTGTEREKPSIGFIGAGKLANALAPALRRAGYAVSAAASRRFASAKTLAARVEGCTAYRDAQAVANACTLVVVATPDDAISTAISRLNWRPNQAVAHCSGAKDANVLAPAASRGATTGVFHPLQTFAGGKPDATNIQGITFSLEAEGVLLADLKEMAESLGGRWVVLRAEDKALYHASAVITSNYMVTLVSVAAGLWTDFGVGAAEATTALLPLMKGTLANIERVGLPGCLTGPIARGDIGTIRRHLQAIKARAPSLEEAYRELGQLTIPLACAAGTLDKAATDSLTEVLTERV